MTNFFLCTFSVILHVFVFLSPLSLSYPPLTSKLFSLIFSHGLLLYDLSSAGLRSHPGQSSYSDTDTPVPETGRNLRDRLWLGTGLIEEHWTQHVHFYNRPADWMTYKLNPLSFCQKKKQKNKFHHSNCKPPAKEHYKLIAGFTSYNATMLS